MPKKSIADRIMDEGAVLVTNTKNEVLELKKNKKPPSKTKISPKETQKIISETKKLTPEPIIKTPEIKVMPEINYVIEETTRYDINWIYLRKMLLDFFKFKRTKKQVVTNTSELKIEIEKKKKKSLYNLYEDWFNEIFNKKLSPEDTKLKKELIEGLKPEGDLSDEWQLVNDKDMDKLLEDIPSLIQIKKKPIEKDNLILPEKVSNFKSGKDFIDLIQNSNHSIEQTREFYIAEIKRLEDESNLMKSALLKTVTDNIMEG